MREIRAQLLRGFVALCATFAHKCCEEKPRRGWRGAWQARGMSLPIFVVDAFTSEAFRGNPAAVVLGHGDEEWMQQVAAEMRHSETAFVRPRADGGFDLRW